MIDRSGGYSTPPARSLRSEKGDKTSRFVPRLRIMVSTMTSLLPGDSLVRSFGSGRAIESTIRPTLPFTASSWGLPSSVLPSVAVNLRWKPGWPRQ